MKGRLLSKNIISSISLQIVTIISGFVVPKVILSYFGSEANGLLSSITQFLNYIQLLEGGLTSVIMAALYKPLYEKDYEKVSGIINATRSFFRTVGFVYVGYMLIIAFVYPIVVDTGYSYTYSVALVLVLAVNLFVQYFFSLTFKILLNADRKVYFVSITQIIAIILNTVLVVIIARKFDDLLILKIGSALVYCLQPILFNWYINRHYRLDKTIKKDNQAIKQRWDGFQINLAYFIHTNTDVIILTFFSSLSNVSVYSVYLLIVNALKSLVNSISQAILPSFGNVLVQNDRERINTAFDFYEFGISTITIFLFSCGIVLITPFVDVYTNNISDAMYHQPLFGTILCLAEMVYCFRDPYVAAAYSANRFKQVSKFAVIEAVINIVISICLVFKFGIVGVATGTLISMLYRMIAHIVYLKDNVLHRPIKKSLVNCIQSSICILLIVIASSFFRPEHISSYYEWIVFSLVVCIIAASILIAKCYICNKRFFIIVIRKLGGKKDVE